MYDRKIRIQDLDPRIVEIMLMVYICGVIEGAKHGRSKGNLKRNAQDVIIRCVEKVNKAHPTAEDPILGDTPA